ncbi:MAG: hypothetical protein ACYDC8_17290 [Gammaproteobacteria bacterium]
MLSWAVPQAAQARGDNYAGYHFQKVSHDDDDEDEGPGYGRGRGWGRHHHHYREYYAPRYYDSSPDVVVYPAPPTYYYAPEPVYPREYGSVGIHLDYNYPY